MDARITPVARFQLAPGQVATPSLGLAEPPPVQLAPGQVAAPSPGADSLDPAETSPIQLAPGQAGAKVPVAQLAPGQAEAEASHPGPLPSDRFALRLTIDRRTHDKLRYAQALLSHSLPPGDIAKVLERALDALIGQLEKRKFGACKTPQAEAKVAARAAKAEERARSAAAEDECARRDRKDLESGLRGLGISAQEARRAIASADTLPLASLEERMRAALRFLCPKVVRIAPPGERMAMQPG
jgi:hypothetical protein